MDADKRCEYRDDRGQCCLPDKHFVEHLPSQRDLTLQQSQWYVHEARLAYTRGQADGRKAERSQWETWNDADDEWSEAIRAAFPTRSGAHAEYGVAMLMVGHRRSKGALVALVTWLLVELKRAGAPVGKRPPVIHWNDDGTVDAEATVFANPQIVKDALKALESLLAPRSDPRISETCPRCCSRLWDFDVRRGFVPVRCACEPSPTVPE